MLLAMRFGGNLSFLNTVARLQKEQSLKVFLESSLLFEAQIPSVARNV